MKRHLLLAAFGLSALTATAQIHAGSVVSYNPGLQKDGGAIPAVRSNTANALGAPQNSDTQTPETQNNFVSLGFGGSIVLEFSSWITSGPGADVDLFETTWGQGCATYPEKADAYFSQDGVNWVYGGTVCHNGSVELPASLGWARYIKIVDVSNPASFTSRDAEGWDVDGVTARYAYTPTRVPACEYGVLRVVSYEAGTKKNGSRVPASRDNADYALEAEINDHDGRPGFVTLGFDNPRTATREGVIVLEFASTIFDRTGADFTVYESSWGGSPNFTDATEPETAELYGSNDGVTWTRLNTIGEPAGVPNGRVLRDGMGDISAMPLLGGARTMRFLKIVEVSDYNSSLFNMGADGYDLDGVVAMGCMPAGSARTGVNEGFAPAMTVSPNPAVSGSSLTVSFEATAAGTHTVELFDMTGRKVQSLFSGEVQAGAQSLNLPVAGVRSGAYMIRISGSGAAHTARVVISE